MGEEIMSLLSDSQLLKQVQSQKIKSSASTIDESLRAISEAYHPMAPPEVPQPLPMNGGMSEETQDSRRNVKAVKAEEDAEEDQHKILQVASSNNSEDGAEQTVVPGVVARTSLD